MATRLAEAQARAADLEHSLKRAAASEAALLAENERLIERLTVKLEAQAMALDSERERHEASLQQQQQQQVAAAAKPPPPGEGGPASEEERPPLSPSASGNPGVVNVD